MAQRERLRAWLNHEHPRSKTETQPREVLPERLQVSASNTGECGKLNKICKNTK